MRYFISISYRGTSYYGWQIQPNQKSIQEVLENAFTIYLGQKTSITGAGRTDTGVHAINYVAHFDSGSIDLNKDLNTILYKINAILPTDIVVNDICQVNNDAHARFDAYSRTYKYFVHTKKEPFNSDYSLFYPYNLDIDRMNNACQFFLGSQDFTSLAKLHGSSKTNICDVTAAKWEKVECNILSTNLFYPSISNSFCFTVSANRFLRNMVRAMVGSLLEVGRGRKSEEWIKELLEEKNRSSAGNSVSSNALFLCEILYPYQIFNNKL